MKELFVRGHLAWQPLNTLEGVDQAVDLVRGVVERKRRPDRRFDAEAPQRRLGTVMAGADGDPLLVQQPADLFGAPVRQHEGQHADFFARRADQPQAIDACESSSVAYSSNSCS